jgi:hypothetical protein
MMDVGLYIFTHITVLHAQPSLDVCQLIGSFGMQRDLLYHMASRPEDNRVVLFVT